MAEAEIPVVTAINQLNKAVKTSIADQKLATSINNKGVDFADQGNHDLAGQFYIVAFTLDPENDVIARNMLKNLCIKENKARALEFAQQQFSMRQHDKEFVQKYSDLLIEMEMYQEAIRIHQDSETELTEGPDSMFYLNFAICFYKLRQFSKALEYFHTSNELEEGEIDYQYIIECSEEAGIFASEEAFMLNKLVIAEESALSLSARRYWMAKFYLEWFEHLEDKMCMDEESNRLGKQAVYNAHKYANHAGDFAQMDSDSDKNEELDQANQLLCEIDALIKKIEQGFEPPSPEM